MSKTGPKLVAKNKEIWASLPQQLHTEKTLSGNQIKRSRNKILGTRSK